MSQTAPSEAASIPAPSRTTERVSGLDLARAFAILGMVVINFKESFVEMAEAEAGLFAWFSNLPSGRASTLFVTLAGVGIMLMARGAAVDAVRKILILRSLFLFVAGNLLYFIWEGDILHFYAVYLLLSALFLIRLPRQVLPPLALFFALGGPVLTGLFPEIDPDAVQYHSVLGMFQNIVAWGLHSIFPWLAFILIGFWIGHHDLRDRGTRRALALLGAFLAFGAPLVSFAAGHLAFAGRLPGELLPLLGTLWSPGLLFTLGRAGSAILVISLAQSIAGRWPNSLIIRAFVATGQLSFTIYIFHVIVWVHLFSRVTGIENYGVEWLFLHVASFYLFIIPAGAIYRHFFRRGPIEWFMRLLCGDTPKKTGAPPPLVRIGKPPLWAWLPIAPAIPAILVIQFLGSPLSWVGTADELVPGLVYGEITVSGDARTFELVLAENCEIVLETFSDRDLFIEVLDAEGEVYAEDDDGGAAYNARVWTNFEPGRYRVVVFSMDKIPGAFILETRTGPKRTIENLPPGTVLLEWSEAVDLDLEIDGVPGYERGGSIDDWDGPAAEWIVLPLDGTHEIAVVNDSDDEGALARLAVKMPDGRIETRSSWVSFEKDEDEWRAFRIDFKAGTLTPIDAVARDEDEENEDDDER